MTSKRFNWEAEKATLTLRVTDGAKETTWRIRKTTSNDTLREVFEELQMAMWEGKPLQESVRTVDAEELAELQKAWEDRSSTAVQATTEEASRAAQAAQVAQLSRGAKWFDNDDEESAFVATLPDYDSGEIK